MNEDNVAIRLKGFIDEMGLTNSQFADQCGIPRPSLSQLLSGRNKKISDVIVGQIHQAFPDMSVLWLLFGEGPMLNKPTTNDAQDVSGIDDASKSVDNGSTDSVAEQRVSGAASSEPARCRPAAPPVRDTKTEELMLEIERLRKHPRKVSQITVYYDDSTFETFYPASSKRP